MNSLYDTLYAPDGGVEDINSVDKLIDNLGHQPITVPLRFEYLNLSCKFMSEGSFSVLGGNSGSGKSMFGLSCGVNCTEQGISWRYLPLESSREFHIRRGACQLDNSWEPLSEDIAIAKNSILRVKEKLGRCHPQFVIILHCPM